MKTERFQVRCLDGIWRYIFCRAVNGSDKLTGSQIISTESHARAFVSYSEEQAARDLEYFAEHANGAQIRFEIPMP